MNPGTSVIVAAVCGVAIVVLVVLEYRRWHCEDWRAEHEREMAEAIGAREARQVAEFEHLYFDVPSREPKGSAR